MTGWMCAVQPVYVVLYQFQKFTFGLHLVIILEWPQERGSLKTSPACL